MEIERVVSGDLNKTIEQCVNALIDVERKIGLLKNELVQTIQTPVQRNGLTPLAPLATAGVFGAAPYAAPATFGAPAAGPVVGATPQAVLGASIPSPLTYGAVPSAVLGAQPWYPASANVSPWLGFGAGFGTPFGAGFGSGVGSGFNAGVGAVAPTVASPVPTFGLNRETLGLGWGYGVGYPYGAPYASAYASPYATPYAATGTYVPSVLQGYGYPSLVNRGTTVPAVSAVPNWYIW